MKFRAPIIALAITVCAAGSTAHADDPTGDDAIETQRTPPRFTPGHVQFGAALQLTAFVNSEFNRTTALWGYRGFALAGTFAPETTVSVARYLMLGVRTGVMLATAGSASADGAELTLSVLDASAIARWVSVVHAGPRAVIIPLLQLEAGFARGSLDLRGQSLVAVLPRLAAYVGLSIDWSVVGLSARVGYQYMRWPEAAFGGAMLDLSAVMFSLQLEQLR